MVIAKRKTTTIAALIAFAALLYCAAPVAAESRVETVEGLNVVYLEGDPYTLGLEQGRLFKDQIQEVYKVYLNDLVYNDWVKKYAILKGATAAYNNPRKAMAKFAEGIVPHVPAEYLEEMKGLAEGSGVDYREVVNMMAHVDYFAVLMCSTLVATGDATLDGKLIEARNLDWASGAATELDPLSAVFVYKPDRGHSFVSVLYPGIVGALTAVNDAGLTVELNFSMAKKNADSGFPAMLIVRHIAQNAATLDEAEKILRGLPRIAGYNVMVTDGKTNDARLIEITADTVGAVGPDGSGLLVSTNHFVTKELAGQNVDNSRFSEKPSEDRLLKLYGMMEARYGIIDPPAAMEMIHDEDIKCSGTVQTMIFKPSENKMWVWIRNRKPDNFIEFDVSKLLGK